MSGGSAGEAGLGVIYQNYCRKEGQKWLMLARCESLFPNFEERSRWLQVPSGDKGRGGSSAAPLRPDTDSCRCGGVGKEM